MKRTIRLFFLFDFSFHRAIDWKRQKFAFLSGHALSDSKTRRFARVTGVSTPCSVEGAMQTALFLEPEHYWSLCSCFCLLHPNHTITSWPFSRRKKIKKIFACSLWCEQFSGSITTNERKKRNRRCAVAIFVETKRLAYACLQRMCEPFRSQLHSIGQLGLEKSSKRSPQIGRLNGACGFVRNSRAKRFEPSKNENESRHPSFMRKS